MNKLLNKIIATLLTFILSCANLITIGSYGITYALSDSELSMQKNITNHDNVEFNAYFEDELHIKTAKTSDLTTLFINIKVKNVGYLQNAQIMFQNVNFKIAEDINNSYVQSVDIEKNNILLKKLNSNSDITLEVPISFLNENKVSLDNFTKEFKTILTGNYIDEKAKEHKISKEIINKLFWKGSAEAVIEGELTKYIPYSIDNNYGVMLQSKVSSGILNNTLPIKQTKLTIEVPVINGNKPTFVNVVVNNTKATNGKEDGLEFSNKNYTYDTEKGILTIVVSNLQDMTSWTKNVKDEYLINYIFENKDLYDYVKTNSLNTLSKIQAEIEVYNNEQTIVTKNATIEMKQKDKLGSITDFEISASEYISKGQMYANYEASNKKETSYFVRYEVNINNTKLTENVILMQNNEELEINSNTAKLKLEKCTYNKSVKISEKIFNKILGENGYIQIYDENNNEFAIIDKNANKDANGNYIIDTSSNDKEVISIVTSKPICEGKIIIEVEKAIKGNFPFTIQQLTSATKLHTKFEGKTSDTNLIKTTQMELKEPISVAELTVNKTDLSNTIENKNVEIRATLDTSNINYSLYKNPTIKIKLPSCISKLKVNSYDILMNNGLKIKNLKAEEVNGTAVIIIELEGTQTEYTIGAEYKGTIIVINTDISVKALTPTITDKIVMQYTNEYNNKSQGTNTVKSSATSEEKQNIIEKEINFIAPTDVMLAHGLFNYNEESENILTTTEKFISATIDAYSKERTVEIYGKIINNYKNNIKDVQILGRFPIQGNKEIDGSNDLGSNISMEISSNIQLKGIDTSKYTVYYSENAEATKDLSNSNNGWTTTRIKNAKSYLIHTKDYIMESGENIEFSYNATIPSNLQYNKNSTEIYKLYYKNISSIGEIEEEKLSSEIQLTTGEGPELTALITPNTETIREGQILKMKVSVKNEGSIKAENVKAIIPLPENTEFMEVYIGTGFGVEEGTLKTIELGDIEPDKTSEAYYYIRIKNNIENIENSTNKQVEIKNTMTITADNIKEEISVEPCILNALEGDVALFLASDISENITLQKDNIINYKMYIYNISELESINNSEVTVYIPKGLTCTDVVIEDETRTNEELADVVTFNKENNTVRIKIDKVEAVKMIRIKMLVGDFEGKVVINSSIKADNIEEHYSNISEYWVEKINLEISELTTSSKYVKETDKLKYYLKITNKGKNEVHYIQLTDVLPSGLILEEATYKLGISGKEGLVNYLVDDKLMIGITEPLMPNESIDIVITVVADLLENKNDKEVQNYLLIKANGFDEVKTNTVTNYIEYDSKLHTQDKEDNEEQEGQENQDTPIYDVNKITGTAWIDSNKNGKRESNEKSLTNTEIVLINKKDNRIVKDIYTGEEKRVKTNNNGQYEIDNLVQGEYIVIFAYNSSLYNLTTYKAKEVSEELNSDAIDLYVTLDGEKRLAGMSDVIKINGNNIRNIDIGVYEAEKFDLRLDKYISKTTLTTPTIGTKTTTYNNKKIAKIDVLNENLGKSNVIIEYRIVITNQGGIPGYAKSIVDYLPEGVSFYSELNKDWYLSENGNVYNTSLANTLINPGESKEITLILSKIITEKSLGTLNNTAEIYESYNEQGLEDINSKVGNKAEDENDLSKADIVFSLVTGNVTTYVIITLFVVLILAFGIVIIKNKVLINKK